MKSQLNPNRPIPKPRHWLAEALALAAVVVMVLAVAPARANVLEQAMATVFSVHSADDDDRFLGSAFLWGDSAEVAVTNAHVVGNAAEVRLVDASGTEEIARVIARDPLRDVAVLAVRPGRRGLTAATRAPGLGAEVWALGAPLGIEFSLTNGRISALARQVDPAAPLRLVQHDAAVNPGSSGGPLVDAAGDLVGMNSQIADGSRMFVGIAYAISAADLQRIVTGLIAETLAPLPELGLKLRPVDRKLALVLGLKPTGLLVDDVANGSIAAVAGVQAGDVILSLGGQKLTEAGDLAFAVEAALVLGETADLTVARGAERLLLSISLIKVEGGSILGLREISGALPQKVSDYSLASMGITLNDNGLVTALTPNSPALLAGVALGDRITRVNGQTVAPDALGGLRFETAALLLLESAGQSRHVLVDPFSETHGIRPVGGANVLDPDVVVF